MIYDTKLNELKLPANKTAAADILMAAGYKKLGSGVFGTVWEKPGADYVLKLFNSSDKPYLSFVAYCLKPENRNNPFFPKFKKNLIKVTDNYYAIRMEKLSPYTGKFPLIINNAFWFLCRRDESYDKRDYEILVQEDPELAKTLEELANYFRKNLLNFYPDLHHANLMKRGSQTVIVDPVCA